MEIRCGPTAVSAAMRHPCSVQGHGLTQCIGWLRRSIEGGKDHSPVPGGENCTFMIGDRDSGALQRYAGHERRLVNAEQGRCLLELCFDVRFRALFHARRLRLVDVGGTVVEEKHGSIPVIGLQRTAIRRTL